MMLSGSIPLDMAYYWAFILTQAHTDIHFKFADTSF